MQKKELSEQVKRILVYSRETVPYYRKILGGLEVSDYKEFENIPILSKTVIKQFYDELTSEDIDKNDMEYESTSGTTGTPFKYSRTKEDKIRSGHSLLKQRINRLGGIPNRCAAYVGQQHEPIKYTNWLLLSLHNLSEDLFEIQIKELMKFKPDILLGPAQALTLLSKYILENNINMEETQIKLIESKAEYLSLNQRLLIENAFGCDVADMYGMRECWGIAYSCKFNKAHVMNDNVFLEIINNEMKSSEEGEEGQIIITCLNNYCTPLIRYQTGDLGRIYYEKCECGNKSPILQLTKYRQVDYINTPNGKTAPAAMRNLFEVLSRFSDKILQFQLIQLSLYEYELRIMSNTFEKLLIEVSNNVEEELYNILGYKVKIVSNFTDNFIKSTNGEKIPWFINKLT